jgi:hypothetical protein
MKKLLVSALLTLGGLALTAGPLLASAFGLATGCGSCCGWCFPQANAFTPPGAGLCGGGGWPAYGYPSPSCGGYGCARPGGHAGPSYAPPSYEECCSGHGHKHCWHKHRCRKHSCRRHYWCGSVVDCPTCGGGEDFGSAGGEIDGEFAGSPVTYGDEILDSSLPETPAPPIHPAHPAPPAHPMPSMPPAVSGYQPYSYPSYAYAPAGYGYQGYGFQGYGYQPAYNYQQAYNYQPAYSYQNVSYSYQPSAYGYPYSGWGYQPTPYYPGNYGYTQPAGYAEPQAQQGWAVPASYSYPTSGWDGFGGY